MVNSVHFFSSPYLMIYNTFCKLNANLEDVGLTLVNIETAFEGVQQQAVLCVIEQRKLSAINALVNDIDPFAFVIIGQVHEVAGKGFTLEREQG